MGSPNKRNNLNKLKNMKLNFSFLPIPEELMSSKSISWGAKHLWGIYAKANMENIRWSAAYLSRRMKCEIREVRRRKAELIKCGLIIVKPRRGRVDDVAINLELVSLIQDKTPDQTDRGKMGHEGGGKTRQGREGKTGQGNREELLLKKSIKEVTVSKFINERRTATEREIVNPEGLKRIKELKKEFVK